MNIDIEVTEILAGTSSKEKISLYKELREYYMEDNIWNNIGFDGRGADGEEFKENIEKLIQHYHQLSKQDLEIIKQLVSKF